MENEAKERAAVTRSQNAMYVLPHDAAAPDEFLASWVQRVDAAAEGVQLLVVTSDTETAAALAGSVVRLADDEAVQVVPVTGPRRAERRVRAGAHVVIGPAADLLALVRTSALKLDALRAVIVAWADELAPADAEALEALFAEVPKTAARTIVATEASDAVEALVERHARRPRRNTAGEEAASGAAVAVSFLTTAPAGRAAALRRVIDALDPQLARVYARNDDSARIVAQALAAMGYRGADAAVTVLRDDMAAGEPEGRGSAPDEQADVIVLFDLPSSAGALARLAGHARRTVVLVQPRQLPSLRRLASGGAVTPLTLPEDTTRGQQEVAALRSSLVAELAGGGIGRELLVLEPLLADHDPIELAAAALRLAVRNRAPSAASAPSHAGGAATAAAGPSGPMTKIFINVGEMDSARPGDFVGAIINEGGVQRDQVGRVDVRDKHAVVEVESSVADQVIERISGTAIRGRRVQARVDQDRPARSDRPERGVRPSRPRGDAPERPSRGRIPDRDRPSRDRSFERDRPARPAARTFDRDRPASGGAGDRPARPPRRDDRGPGAASRGSYGDRDRSTGGRDTGTRGPSRPPRPRRGDS